LNGKVVGQFGKHRASLEADHAYGQAGCGTAADFSQPGLQLVRGTCFHITAWAARGSGEILIEEGALAAFLQSRKVEGEPVDASSLGLKHITLR